MTTAAPVHAGELELWVERAGDGPEVLLIAGLGDPVEAWQFQLDGLADRYRLTAFDNRGAGRTPLPPGPLSVGTMADDAAAPLRALEVPSAHIAGFSGGSVIAQELALRQPEMVRSLVLVSTWARPDAHLRAIAGAWRWMATAAPSERAFLEAFFAWIYTARAHADGTVEQIIDETLAFPHKASPEAIQRTLDAFLEHETANRLPSISAPTLVLAGGQDICTPPRYGRLVAEAIPDRGSRCFRRRRTSPSRRSQTSSTPASTHSGLRSKLAAERPSIVERWARGRRQSTGVAAAGRPRARSLVSSRSGLGSSGQAS